MTLAYRYSNLDRRHEFFLYSSTHSVYHYWVWFYLGQFLNKKGFTLYPYSYSGSKVLKTYKEYDAKTEAKRIANRINKIIK